MDLSKITLFVQANQKAFIALALLVLAFGAALIYRQDVRIALNEFFAICDPDLGCEPNRHTECQNNACTLVDGPGDNECTFGGTECAPPTPTPTPTPVQQHRACNQNDQCRVVSGPGPDECNTTNDCLTGETPTPTPTRTPTPTPTGTPTPSGTPTPTPSGGQFTWRVTRNDFTGSCSDGPWFKGKTLTLSGSVTNNSNKRYDIKKGAYHNVTASSNGQLVCSATTQGAAGGLSISGKTSYPAGSTGSFTLTFNTGADVQCGRYQVDARFVNVNDGSDTTCGGSGCGIMGVVLNHGNNCSGSTPGPTPTPSGTSTPTATPSGTSSPTASPSSPPTPVPLVCAPTSQSVNTNQVAVLSATGGDGTYVWTALGGNPPAAIGGGSFGTVYTTAGSYTVTVTSGTQSANCAVQVTTPPTGLVCSPSSQTVYVNQTATFAATGGTGTYAWSAPNSSTTTGSGTNFSTSYPSAGSQTVTVTSGTLSAICTITASIAPTPTPTPTSTPTTPLLTLSKLVRNVTVGTSDVDTVSASPNDMVEFSITVSSVGNTTVRNVRVQDILPFGLSYTAGTTTVDGVAAADGITSSGITLGDMAPGRVIVIRFRAQVAPESSFNVGTTTLTNITTALSDNAPALTDTAFVSVIRTNPVVSGGQTYNLDISKRGRNLTRGEFAEQSVVNASPNQTVEFIVRVQSLSTVRIDNVMVKDVVPTGIAYIPGTTSVNSVSVADDIVSSAGLNIGSLDPNQVVVIRFSGTVNPASTLPTGTTTVINTVQASNALIPAIIAQLPINIFNGSVAGAVQVPTGAGESILLALAVSGLVTFLYVAYTRTNIFRRREIRSIIRSGGSGEDKVNFRQQ